MFSTVPDTEGLRKLLMVLFLLIKTFKSTAKGLLSQLSTSHEEL